MGQRYVARSTPRRMPFGDIIDFYRSEHGLTEELAQDRYATTGEEWVTRLDAALPTKEAILNIQSAWKRVMLVWEHSQNDELNEAIAELQQAVRFLTGKDTPS